MRHRFFLNILMEIVLETFFKLTKFNFKTGVKKTPRPTSN